MHESERMTTNFNLEVLEPFQTPEAGRAAWYWVLSMDCMEYLRLMEETNGSVMTGTWWGRTNSWCNWSRASKGTWEDRRRILPMPLHALATFSHICLVKRSLQSRIILRCLWSLTGPTSTLLKISGGWIWSNLLREKAFLSLAY